MSREHLGTVFIITAIFLAPVSFVLMFAYAGPEPFFDYRRSDAFTHIGLSTAAIALWVAWSIGIVGLVVAGVFGRRWLIGLLVPAICIFYLIMCPDGYLYDLEHFMLSTKQQEQIGVPILKD
jgi:hypothetical protein